MNKASTPLTAEEERLVELLTSFTHRGQIDNLKRLIMEKLEQIQRLITRKECGMLSCIHDAARRHDLACLKELVQVTGVDIKNKDGQTPLHFAAKFEAVGDVELPSSMAVSDTEEMTAADDSMRSPHGERDAVDDEIVAFLCEQGADTEEQDESGMTPLHYAASKNNLRAARQLLKEGANVDCTDYEKLTPLLMAVRNNHQEMAKLLLDAGADVLYVDGENSNALHHACHHGVSDMLRTVYGRIESQHGKTFAVEALNAKNKDSQTPFHLAILSNTYELTILCIELGADLSICTSTGETVLHLAVRSEDPAIVETVLERGFNVNALDLQNRTPIFNAIEMKHLFLVEGLVQKGADVNHADNNNVTPLLLAAQLGANEICIYLMESKAQVLVENKQWKTPLMLAVEGKHQDVVETLMSCEAAGMLLTWEDVNQDQPIHVAVKVGSLNITSFLINCGADTLAQNRCDHTPLHVAAIHGRFGIVQKLLESNPIAVYEEDEDGNLPVHLAAKHGFAHILKRLLQHAQQIHDRNSAGWTPLMFAAVQNRLDCIKLLLGQGANVNSGDKSNMTPLFLACSEGHSDVVKLLLEAGADPGIRVHLTHAKYRGWNALDIAADRQRETCVQLILKGNRWEAALRNETYEGETVSTPLRRLICDMPKSADLALYNCIVKSTAPKQSRDYTITFNFEFLDDQNSPVPKVSAGSTKDLVTKPLLSDAESLDHNKIHHENSSEESEATPVLEMLNWRNPKPSRLDRTHPIKLMLEKHREDLLNHRLVLALLALKWTRVCFAYYLHLMVYLLFLALFTSYMFLTRPPYLMYPGRNFTTAETCEMLRAAGEKAYYHDAAVPKYGVLVMSIVGLILEVLQLVHLRRRYFTMDNLVDVSLFCLALITTIDTSLCMTITGLRQPWQWGTGTVGIFLAWINLLLIIREGPVSGIFVIMFVVVSKTFVKFFLVFSPFLIAFGISFHSLLANQLPFRDFPSTMIKTFAMVIGELDVSAIMFERFTEDGLEKQVYYVWTTYLMLFGFIALMAIVMMNLLVGLAVDDIKGVQRIATIKRQELKINMLLSTETLLSRFRTNLSIPRTYVYKPNNPTGLVDKLFHKFYEQSTRTVQEISEVAPADEEDDQQQGQKKRPEEILSELQAQLLQIAKLLNRMVDREGPRDTGICTASGGLARSRRSAGPPASKPMEKLLIDDDVDEEPVYFGRR